MREAERAMQSAVRMLAGRAHSEMEIHKKLLEKGYAEPAIAEVMEKLAAYDLTDDKAFAEQWAKWRAQRGLGPYRIKRELSQKGIADEHLDAALSEMADDGFEEAAVSQAIKSLRGETDDRARRRAYGALVRRGFSYEMAGSALRQAIKRLRDDCEDADDFFDE